jgi:ribosomal protein S18 acetylase RimI-like enzyme
MVDLAITLRSVVPQDEPFLFELYAIGRADELAQVPWSSSERDNFLKMQFVAQQKDYQRRFPNALHQIILRDGHTVGHQHVASGQDELRILDIAIVPALRGTGIGTQLITRLLDEAALEHKPVRIYVEQMNPSLNLFERLGFSRIEDIGSHFLLERKSK